MRRDLIVEAEKAAAAKKGAQRPFWYLHGRHLVVPGLVLGAVVLVGVWAGSVGWGLVLGYLLLGLLVAGGVVVLVALALGMGSGGRRLSSGFRPPKLPPGI